MSLWPEAGLYMQRGQKIPGRKDRTTVWLRAEQGYLGAQLQWRICLNPSSNPDIQPRCQKGHRCGVRITLQGKDYSVLVETKPKATLRQEAG